MKLGDPEIENLDQIPSVRALGEEKVLGLNIAVDDPCLVRCRQSTARLEDEIGRARLTGKRTRAAEEFAAVLALEELHQQIRGTVRRATYVHHRRDVGVFQPARRLGLVLETPKDLRVRRRRWGSRNLMANRRASVTCRAS